MVIDLSRMPVLVSSDVCPDSIVIRTARDKTVDGILRRKIDPKNLTPDNGALRNRNEKKVSDVYEVAVEAQLSRSGQTLQEMRLPLRHMLTWDPKNGLLPEPFEVATAYREGITKRLGTWRIQIKVEILQNQVKNGKNGRIWLITIRDEGARRDIVTATMKLPEDEGPVLPKLELLPIQKKLNVLEKPESLSVWARLRMLPMLMDGNEEDE